MATPAELAGQVADAWFGADLPAAARKRLVELGRVRHFEPGARIDREGEATKELGIVRSGRISLRTYVPGRGWLSTLTIEPGDVFGWSALVPPHQATATAIVLEPVEAVVFEAGALREALAADQSLAAALYPLVLRAVARRLGATRLQLLDLFALEDPRAW
jgi:CRP/FNR family transcriptional regulator, cyclic AMP receptor protein